MRAWSPVIVLRECAPDRRVQSEHFEIIPRNKIAVNALRLIVPAHAEADGESCQHAAEYRVAIAEVLIHRIRERESVIVAGVNPSPPRPWCAEQNQLVGMLHWQRPQHRLIHQT